MKRILCVLLALILLISVAACSSKGGKPSNDSSTTSTTEVLESTDDYIETQPNQTETTATESTAAPIQTTNSVTTAPPSPTAAPPKNTEAAKNVPTESGAIIALYNSAITSSPNLKQTSYKRELIYCHTVVLRQNIDLIDMFPDVKDVAGEDDTNEAPHNLVKLSSDNVSSAKLTEQNGNIATYDIRLQPATATQDMSQGHGGYPGLVLSPEVTRLIGEVTAKIGFPGVKVKDDMQFKLTDGKIIIKIDTVKKQILSADVTYKQGGNATASFAAFNAATELTVSQAYTYR